MMYVDYDEENHKWLEFNPPRREIVMTDALLLSLFAGIVIKNFKDGGSFPSLDTKIQSIRNSHNLDDALSEIDTISGFNLQDTLRGIRDSAETDEED